MNEWHGHRAGLGGGIGGNTPASTTQPAEQFDTCCFVKLLEDETLDRVLRREARLVDVPHEAETFWVPAGAQTTTTLESMVKNIFDYHVANFAARNPHHSSRVSTSTSSGTKEHIIEDTTRSSERTENGGSGFGSRQGEVRMSSVVDSACSGAEWWIQIREEGYHADLGMPFHWDKDEQLRDTTGVTKFPEVSTVTYLTEHGAPTLVLESRATEMGAVVEGPILRAFVSYPSTFKHLAFDGRFLHGVPEILSRKGQREHSMESRPKDRWNAVERCKGRDWHSENGVSGADSDRNTTGPTPAIDATTVGQTPQQERGLMRVTLLVNVWLCHKPLGIAPLPQAVAATLGRGAGLPALNFEHRVEFSPVKLPINAESCDSCGDDGVSEGGALGRKCVFIKTPLSTTTCLEMYLPRSEILSAQERRGLHAFVLRSESGFRARLTDFVAGASGTGERQREVLSNLSGCERGGLGSRDPRREGGEEADLVPKGQREDAPVRLRSSGVRPDGGGIGKYDTAKRKREP